MCVSVRARARMSEIERDLQMVIGESERERESERRRAREQHALKKTSEGGTRHVSRIQVSFLFFFLHASNALSSHFHIGYTRTRLHVRAPGQAPGKHQQSAFFFFFSRVRGPPQS